MLLSVHSTQAARSHPPPTHPELPLPPPRNWLQEEEEEDAQVPAYLAAVAAKKGGPFLLVVDNAEDIMGDGLEAGKFEAFLSEVRPRCQLCRSVSSPGCSPTGLQGGHT